MRTHTLSPETPADTAEIRDLLLAAFDTSYEADLVEALRGNPNAWEPGISLTPPVPSSATFSSAVAG